MKRIDAGDAILLVSLVIQTLQVISAIKHKLNVIPLIIMAEILLVTGWAIVRKQKEKSRKEQAEAEESQNIDSMLRHFRTERLKKGDPNCIYNANSVYVQCAVNPTGDCKTCAYFIKKTQEHYNQS